MAKTPICFVVMPFKAELNYFFLYLQEYLQDKHGVEARRGDHEILTRPLMEKISGDVQSADCVIADVSGGNPNVLYEVGLAHAFQKPVIFLTQDDPAQTPVDVRQYEFIPYHLGRHKEFLANLDNAIQNVFVKRYADWYSSALTTLKEFSQDAGVPYNPASLAEFQGRVMRAERRGETVPERSLPRELAQFFLPKIIADATDFKLINQITEWLKSKFK